MTSLCTQSDSSKIFSLSPNNGERIVFNIIRWTNKNFRCDERQDWWTRMDGRMEVWGGGVALKDNKAGQSSQGGEPRLLQHSEGDEVWGPRRAPAGSPQVCPQK